MIHIIEVIIVYLYKATQPPAGPVPEGRATGEVLGDDGVSAKDQDDFSGGKSCLKRKRSEQNSELGTYNTVADNDYVEHFRLDHTSFSSTFAFLTYVYRLPTFAQADK